MFHAYKLAYDQHRMESGLKYIQLNSMGNAARHVQLIDKIGLRHHLALHRLPFIIQEKAATLESVLHKLLKAGNVTAAKECLRKVFDFYAAEYAKGLLDRDHHVLRNVGFAQERVIHLDVGKLVKEPKMTQPEYAREDAQKLAEAIQRWLERHYPHYSQHLKTYN